MDFDQMLSFYTVYLKFLKFARISLTNFMS